MSADRRHRIDAVVFDMDGVLLDSEPLHDRVQRELARDLGIELSDAHFARMRGVDGETFWSYVQQEHGISVPVDELLERDRQRYIAAMREDPDVESAPGLDATLWSLREAGFPLALASSSSTGQIAAVLDRLELEWAFDAHVGGDEVGQGKPDPAIYLTAARRLHVAPSRCLAVEDSTNGIRAAQAAGMLCCGFQGFAHPDQTLTDADWVISDLREVIPLVRDPTRFAP